MVNGDQLQNELNAMQRKAADVLAEVVEAVEVANEAKMALVASERKLRKRVRQALKVTLAISMCGSIPLVPFANWIDNYLSPWISIPLVLIIETSIAWLALTMGVAYYDHLQAEAETDEMLNN